jgi:antitoxin (DNA-binding transcriptional repressor) of toxin-antitoxin stability system
MTRQRITRARQPSAQGARRRASRLRRRVPTATLARRISATDAARTFSDLLNRVQYRGETVVVERNGTAVCEITPARPLAFTLAELAGLLRSSAKPDPGYWDLVEAITRHQPVVEPSPWGR